MARRISRGEIWLYRFAAPDKLRPVLVLSRPEALEFLNSVTVAPITSTIRDLPSEVVLGIEHGMKGPCAVNFDHVQTIQQSGLTRFVATLPPELMKRVCQALGIAMGCL